MTRSRLTLAAIAMTATLVAGCSSTPDSSPGPATSTPSPAASVTPSLTPSAPSTTVTPLESQHITCTFTNEQQGKLVVTKASRGSTGDFTITGTAPGATTTTVGDGTVSGNTLEVVVGAWYDGTPLGEPAYPGPMTLTGAGAIREARIVSGFEGMTQVGLGLDRARPYRVTWLENPARLVIDVFTG